MTYLLEPVSASYRAVLEATDADLHIPAACDLEVVSAIRRLLLARAIAEDRALDVLADYLALPLERHGHVALVARVLELRDNFTAYDAAYVALAESLSAQLLTTDGRLARAVRTHSRVDVIGA